MRHKDFNIKEHGFVGHLAEPDVGSDRAVIVIMGGEQSILPGIKFAERFADYGITGLSVSLFGAEGLPDAPNQVPLDMFIPAVEYLREKKGIEHISVYGQSMGSIFAVLVAQYIGGMENLIMVSPTHVPFEGTAKDKKTMTGRSVATFKAEDIPFISADFSKIKAAKYYKHPDVEYKVMGMWIAYHDAYADVEGTEKAMLHVEKTGSRVLLIAGHEDEAWPAEYSVREIEKNLKDAGYDKDVKVIVYPHGSHAYKTGSYDDHAHKGADLAREILGELGLTDRTETDMICSAIYHHDDKLVVDSPMDEVLKDADVIHHCMNDLSKPIKEKEQVRFDKLCAEFGM